MLSKDNSYIQERFYSEENVLPLIYEQLNP